MIRQENIDIVLDQFPVDPELRNLIRQALSTLDRYATDERGLRTFLIDGVLSNDYIGCYDSSGATASKRGDPFLFGFDWRGNSLRFVFPQGYQPPQIPTQPWDKEKPDRVCIDLMRLRLDYIETLILTIGQNVINDHFGNSSLP